MDKLLGNLHWLIILYAGFSIYNEYSEFEMQFNNLKSQKTGVQTQLNLNKNKLKRIAKYRDDLDKYKQWVVEVTDQIEKLRKRLPSEINDGFMMQSIREKATSLNVMTPTVRSGKDILNGFYIKKNYTLKGRGTFLQFLVFSENIDKFEQLLNVSAIELVGVNRKDQKGRFFVLNGEVELEAYRYNPSFAENSIADDEKNKTEGKKK